MMSLPVLFRRFDRGSVMSLCFLGISAALGIALWFGIAGLQSMLNDAQRSVDESLALLEQQSEYQSSTGALVNQLRSLQERFQSLRTKLPETAEESEFLNQLSEMAVATGVTISDFRPGGVSKRTDCKSLELKVRGTASYASLCRWLARLTDLPRVVRVSQLSVSGPSTQGGDCAIDIQLDLVFGIDTTKQSLSKVKS